MLYREIIALCCGIHTEHVNTLCGQNVELWDVQTNGVHSTHKTLRFNIIPAVVIVIRCLLLPLQPSCHHNTFVINISMDTAHPACLIFYFTFLYQIRSSCVAGQEPLKQLYKQWVDFIVFIDFL